MSDDLPPPARRHSGGERSNVSRSGVFGRRSRTKARAGRPWIMASFARVEHGLSLRQHVSASLPDGTVRPVQRHQHGFATEPVKRKNLFFPLERFAVENICRTGPMFRPAGFTLPAELDAASQLRLLRCRGGVSLRLTPGAFSKRKCSKNSFMV